MKLITILINNRTDHIVNFDSDESGVNSYIVENSGGNTNLFKFYPDSDDSYNNTDNELILQTDAGPEEAHLMGLKVISGNKEDDQKLEVKYFNLYVEYSQELDDLSYRKKNSKSSSQKEDSDATVDFPKDIDIDGNYWDGNDLLVHFSASPSWSYIIKVSIFARNEANGEISKQLFTINLAPRENIFDVVLDYGSEASQMLISNRGEGNINRRNCVPLFDLFKTSYGDKSNFANIQDDDFAQYDNDGGAYFIKSCFYAKKELDKSDRLSAIRPIEENSNIKFLTPVGELDLIRQDYFTIPNIKISGHGGVLLPDILVGKNKVPRPIFEIGHHYYYRCIVNSFLNQALLYIDSFDEECLRPYFLNLYFLMPNIYTQAELTRNLRYAFTDVLSMAEFNASCIKGVEVAAVSESDASFLGYVSSLPANKKKNISAGRYLIMDAGKGTLDFSVLEYKPENATGADSRNVFSSIYRSGIIGAGNAITYSIFIAILFDIYKNFWGQVEEEIIIQEISNFVTEKITGPLADESNLSKMMSKLEEYKILYNNGQLSIQKFPIDPRKFNLESFSDFRLDGFLSCLNLMIKNHYLINDTSFIDNMIDKLCYDAAIKFRETYNAGGDTKDSKINYVVFAGRGFQMKQFRSRMVEILKQENPHNCASIEPKLVTSDKENSGASFKNLCLFIVNPLSSGRYNGSLVGMPQIIRYEGRGGIGNDDINDKVSNIQGGGGSVDDNVPNSNGENKSGSGGISETIMGFAKKGLETLKSMIPGSQDEDDDDVAVNDSMKNNKLTRMLVDGYSGVFKSSEDLVTFSGVAYEKPGAIKLDIEFDIFFDGNNFIVRQGGYTYSFGNIVNLNGANVFESTFPYGQIQNGKTIPLPLSISNKNSHNDHSSYSEKSNMSNSQSEGYGIDDDTFLSKYNK